MRIAAPQHRGYRGEENGSGRALLHVERLTLQLLLQLLLQPLLLMLLQSISDSVSIF